MSLQAVIRQPQNLSLLLPQARGRIAAFGARAYDSLPSEFRTPVFTFLKYTLTGALVIVPLVGALASIKITYIALAALAIFIPLVIVKLTLQRGSINELNNNFGTWAQEGHLSSIAFGIAAGATLDLADDQGRTPLIRAAQSGHVEVTRLLANSGARIDLPHLNRLLLEAAENGNTATVQALIAARTNIDVQDHHSRTALSWAIHRGHIETVRALIAARANVNAQDQDGWTALIQAAYLGHTAAVQALIAARANIEAQARNGLTAIIYAVLFDHPATVQALIAAGANVNAQDRYGRTALMQAGENSGPATVQALMAAGANVNAQDHYGRTALMHVVGRGHTETVQALIAAGANISLQDRSGKTALTVANESGHEGIATILRSQG